MKFFRNYPFVRLLSFQLSGICLASFIPGAGIVLSGLLLILITWLITLIRQKKYPYDLVHSATLIVLIITISFINTRKNQHYGLMTDYGLRCFEAEVLNNPLKKANSFQTIIRIIQTDSFQIKNQKLLVYLEKGEKASLLRPGDLIFARSAIGMIRNAGNPFEFDYRNYLSRKHIWHTAYITSGNYTIHQNEAPSFLMTIKRFQKKLVSKLKEKLTSDQAFQMVSALSLGYRDELTKETRSYFISTGAMHILSVSGLHVAMIFLFLNTIFSFLRHSRTGRFLYFFIMLFCLWGYAMLTGFSPPVQRAAVMFSFILIGNNLNRPASVYNSIAASAFFLLLFNPDLFFHAGFQLSYLAVISIVFFYPKINQLLKTGNWFLKYAWQLCCVSLAAQIGIFPLVIYYFQQFPVYFWLSNFVVVPAGYLILGLTGTFFLLSHFENIASLIAQVIDGTADFTLFLLKKISELPFSLLEGLSVSFVQFACLLMLPGLTMLFIVYRRRVFFFTGLVLIFLFQVDGLIQKIRLLGQRKLIVYRTDEKLIHLINGRRNYILTESKSSPNPSIYSNVLLNLKLKEPLIIHMPSHYEEKNFRDLIIQRPIIQFTDKSLILTKGSPVKTSSENSMTFSSGLLDLDQIVQNKIHLMPD